MTTRSPGALGTLLLGLLAAGCSQNELRPLDPAPVAPRGALATRGGARLELDPDGTLVQRTPASDVQGLLGAALEDRPEGLVVTQRLEAGTPLEADDRIAAVYPSDVARVGSLTRTWVLESARPVNRMADLAGFALAPATLHLVVERGGETVVVARTVGASTPVAVRLWDPTATRKLGYEAVAIGSLPPELQPVYPGEKKARPGDVLVTWLSVDSPLAHAGLRPLDVLRDPRADSILERVLPPEPPSYLRPDGVELSIEEDLGPADELDLGVLATGERDAKRTEVEVALGVAYTGVSLRGYDARADGYWRAHVSTLGSGLLALVHVDGPPGVGEVTYVNLTPLAITPTPSVTARDWDRPYFEPVMVTYPE